MIRRDTSTVIGVNLSWLVPGVVGGSEEYTMRLLSEVGRFLGDDLRLRLYVRPELPTVYPDLATMHELVVSPGTSSKPVRVGLEQTWLAAKSRADHAVHHPGGTVPFVRAQPTIVTVHDLQPLEMPENFHPVKRAWLGRALPYATRVARLVLCPSQFTADRLHDLLDIPVGKIRVIPHGHRRPRIGAEVMTEPSDDPQHRFGRYLLYPAIAYGHKRHIDVVRLLARLRFDLDDVNVVFTGRPGPELAAVRAEAERLGVSKRVYVLGRVPEAELALLYRSAVALVFPSAYEGFGNPVLEAMNADCPVVASDGGALPEVVGGAGLLVPVGDIDGLADAVTRLLDDPALADSLRAKGRKRAGSFDSGIAARRLAEVYAELADSRQS